MRLRWKVKSLPFAPQKPAPPIQGCNRVLNAPEGPELRAEFPDAEIQRLLGYDERRKARNRRNYLLRKGAGGVELAVLELALG